MGLMDRVREQAQQAVAQAQQGLAQGQARLDAMQTKRQADALLRDLGAAYYAQQRGEADAESVSAALSRVEAFAAEHGPLDPARGEGAAGSGPAPTTSAAGTPPPHPAPPTTPPGGYSLDDL